MNLPSKGDAVTYIGLVTVAVIEILDQSRKDASPILASPIWSYVPIVLLTLVGIIWLGRQIMPIIRSNSATSQRQHTAAKGVLTNPSIHFPTPNWHEPLKPIVNQHFRNETVELDGKNFVDCTFEKVTFLYNGTMPTQFIGCNRQNEGEYTLRTDNPVVFITHEIVNWLGVTGGAKTGFVRNLINKDSR